MGESNRWFAFGFTLKFPLSEEDFSLGRRFFNSWYGFKKERGNDRVPCRPKALQDLSVGKLHRAALGGPNQEGHAALHAVA